MKGEWKITKNCVAGEFSYAVYRLIDTNRVDHSGNREFATGLFKDRKEAEAVLEKLKD